MTCTVSAILKFHVYPTTGIIIVCCALNIHTGWKSAHYKCSYYYYHFITPNPSAYHSPSPQKYIQNTHRAKSLKLSVKKSMFWCAHNLLRLTVLTHCLFEPGTTEWFYDYVNRRFLKSRTFVNFVSNMFHWDLHVQPCNSYTTAKKKRPNQLGYLVGIPN